MYTKKINTIHIAVLTVLATCFIAWQTQANKWFVPAEPTVTVSVDFEKVFSSLEERAFEEAKVQAIIEEMNADIERRRQEIADYDQEFELYEQGSDKWHELLQQQQLKVLEYQAQVEYGNLRKNRELSKGTRLVYEHIRQASAELAEQNGWDYVIVNDTAIAFPEGDDVDMGLEISSRRILFANPALDVTDALIEYMNNSFDEMAVR